jgi:hypothetical protein
MAAASAGFRVSGLLGINRGGTGGGTETAVRPLRNQWAGKLGRKCLTLSAVP